MISQLRNNTLRLSFFSIALIFISISAKAVELPNEITLAADVWCPYNCKEGAKAPGYMLEIANKVFSAKGIKVAYKTMNWSRALSTTRTGQIDGVIGALKEDAPDFVFSKNSLGVTKTSLWVSRKNKIIYSNINSLNGFKLGVIKGYSYGSQLDNYIAENLNDKKKIKITAGQSPLNRNIQSLLHARIDVIAEDEAVMKQYLHNQEEVYPLENIATIEDHPIYIAFSPSLAYSNALTEILNKGIEELRNNGQLSLILTKYGLTDWESKKQTSDN